MLEVRESQIENVLVNAPLLVKRILRLDEEPRLLSRQMPIPSGRLDLLYAYRSKLLLIELKVVQFHQEFIKQILGYKNDLINYQTAGKLLQGEILPFLLVSSDEGGEKSSVQNNVVCIGYNPADVLSFFYQNFKPIASISAVKPIDIGIWNLHLIHDFIYLLDAINSVNALQQEVGGSTKTLYNKIKFANELRLIEWQPNKDEISLSKLGVEYVKQKDAVLPQRLSEGQVEIIKNLVVQSPYESSVILGIASVVESVFAMAKNTYPVPLSELTRYFSYYAGKHFDWKTDKAKYSGTRMYSNYAVDLGLLAKTDNAVYLTPEGVRFTIQMQLHKSLKMAAGLKLE